MKTPSSLKLALAVLALLFAALACRTLLPNAAAPTRQACAKRSTIAQ